MSTNCKFFILVFPECNYLVCILVTSLLNVRVSPFKAFEQVFFDTSTDLISDRAKVLLESKKERKRIYKENNISIILLLAMFFYEGFFSVINLDEIIDKCKEFNDPQFKYSKTSGTEFTDFFVKNLAPFVFSVSVFAVVLGFLSQRAVHVWRLDQKFKLLRYKNLWFYLFRGTLTEGKSAEFLRRKNPGMTPFQKQGKKFLAISSF